MNKSESIAALSASMVKAQAKIEGATKDKTNPHFRSKYADLASVVEAIKKPVTDAGLAWTQLIHDADNAAKVETIILHSSGEWLSCGIIAVPVAKADAQGYGSALTYARRYSLSAAFGVAPEDDDGNAAAAARPQITAAPITPTTGVRESLTEEQIAKVDQVAGAMLDWINNGSIDDAVLVGENSGLDVEEKAYLWSQFDSKQRSAMTKAAKAMRAKAEVATQA